MPRVPAPIVVPAVPRREAPREAFDEAVKANLDRVLGRVGGDRIEQLPASASLADVIAALNVIIARLQ